MTLSSELTIQSDELISVIVPSFNAERFIGAAIESVLAQTHRQIEVVVVDDGSTDRTPDIVNGIAQADSRVRLLRTQNRGVSAARNLAIAETKGRLIASLDADDLWHPDKLTKQLARLRQASPNVGLIYCWSAAIDAQGMVLAEGWSRSNASGNVLQGMIVDSFIGNGSVPLMRRSAVEAAGGYDESLRLGEDWKFYIAMAEVCEFDLVPEYLTGYRLSPRTASLQIEEMDRSIAAVTQWITRRWPDLPREVLRDRAFSVSSYLSYLAIRRRAFGFALIYRARGVIARPSHIFSMAWVDFWGMWIGHLIGIRSYNWRFWRTPQPFIPRSVAAPSVAAPSVVDQMELPGKSP